MTDRAEPLSRRRRFGLWLCRVMGWHASIVPLGFDGLSFEARCERCGYVGLIDSNGDLF